ncbi:hypothetical protein [Streptomyces sp. SJL17-1]|uniref:hypothetical protein n=1 Tax=Streptomyces sp. SJL17-1 TaxID=2967223 RepID=UPI00296757B0|nr:hypothetical protein [Streptomyces sp. SJL17-1]
MTNPVPKPVPYKRPISDEIEYVIRSLVASIREDGSVLEDTSGDLVVHPAVPYLSTLVKGLPNSRISDRRAER